MATREALALASEALDDAAARLLALAAEGVDAHPTSEELAHADAYASTAAMLRRRAAKLHADGHEAHAVDALARAALFDARAAAKRAGQAMPRALRTPAESLARVDEFRRALAALVEAFHDVEPDEWQAFVEALAARGFGPERATGFTAAMGAIERVLEALGRDPDPAGTFRPFASPTDPVAGSTR